MDAKPPVGVHDAGTIAGVGDCAGDAVDVAAGAGRPVADAVGGGVALGAGLAAVVQATTRKVAPINAESRDGERLMVRVLLPVSWQRDVRVDRLLRACRHADTRTVRRAALAGVSADPVRRSLSANRHREHGVLNPATHPIETGRHHPGA
jgi:hypothetical protein